MNFEQAIQVATERIGADYLFVITGGTAHIGASATACLRNGEWIVQTAAVPGHREQDIIGPLALYAARTLQRTCTIVMGVHFDGVTKAEIERIVAHIRSKTAAKIDELLR